MRFVEFKKLSQTELIKLKEGKHSVYEELFNNLYTPLCNYAFSIIKNTEEVEDIVQKTFYKLWDQRETIDIKTSIKSYMYRMVHNACLNRIKQTKTRAEHNVSYVYEKGEYINDVEQSVYHSELEKSITEAIEKLPPKCREVFKMSRLEQLSYAEIALKLNISTNTVENHIAKALKILRNNLKDFLPLFLYLIFISK